LDNFDENAAACARNDLLRVPCRHVRSRSLHLAFQAIGGNTIGRKRHVCASLRELCMHVLHRLSPDPEVKKWNSNPEFYKDGKPNRRLRLMYICRQISNGAFTDYLNKTISMHVELLNTLNEVHAVNPKFDDFQLRLLFTDAISMLRFMLRTGRFN
jgi:predicted pPIWI-associating nuclease